MTQASGQNTDCLFRPYLNRRRVLSGRSSRFKGFSLRNFPLYLDQMEELSIPPEDMEQYAKSMADALAMAHWAAGIDGNDVGFALASPSRDRDHGDQAVDNVLGVHTIWSLSFDLCRDVPHSEEGVRQVVTALFRNDPFTLGLDRARCCGRCFGNSILPLAGLLCLTPHGSYQAFLLRPLKAERPFVNPTAVNTDPVTVPSSTAMSDSEEKPFGSPRCLPNIVDRRKQQKRELLWRLQAARLRLL
jgi:hypothetical protein